MKRFFCLLLTVVMIAACIPALAENLHYDSCCGMAAEPVECVPAAAWVQFHPDTHEILDVYVVGSFNPALNGAFDAAEGAAFVGMKAEKVPAGETPVAEAVKDACDRYLAGMPFIIRPYQTMAVDRYMANNPYFKELAEDAVVEVSVVAAFPEGCVTVVTEDVKNGETVTYPAGMSTSAFAYGEKNVSVSHSAVLAHEPGVAVIAYTFNGETVLDAVDVLENYTLYPEVLSGSDAYGKVIGTFETEDKVTYVTLGDKAMNFPGGTAGSTVVTVVIDKATRSIESVYDHASSDSTYLANEWEYNGGFTAVGDSLFGINGFTGLFAGRSADEQIARYVLSSNKDGIVGGVAVEGGIDMVVTGATRTPNAIVSAVNAALEAFAADHPAK